MKEEIIIQFADVFCLALAMLREEIEENKESINNFSEIDSLVEEWNKLYDKYIVVDNMVWSEVQK